MGCAGLMISPLILQSCAASKIVRLQPEEDTLTLSKSEFTTEKGKTLRYLLVEVTGWEYPIAVFRRSETEFKSVLLKCTHQGTELKVYGDLISCPAHGSEFSNEGKVFNGPATRNLTSFQTNFDDEFVTILLS